MKLIDKDAALAVIDKRMNQIAIGIIEIPLTGREKADATLEREVLGKVRSLIDSLEVKEVDLEKELTEWHKKHFSKKDTFNGKSGFYLTNSSQLDIAKHFFELGLNASNPLTWEDIKILQEKSSEVFAEVAKGNIDYYQIYPTQQSFLEEVLKRFKAQKGE